MPLTQRPAEPDEPFPPEDCVLCGRCCFSELPEYVRVFGVDLDRMDERAQSYTVFIGNRCYMRIEDGRCAALRSDPDTGRHTCEIYEMRSDVCRSLERGSGACRGEWSEKAARPEARLVALRRARGG